MYLPPYLKTQLLRSILLRIRNHNKKPLFLCKMILNLCSECTGNIRATAL